MCVPIYTYTSTLYTLSVSVLANNYYTIIVQDYMLDYPTPYIASRSMKIRIRSTKQIDQRVSYKFMKMHNTT